MRFLHPICLSMFALALSAPAGCGSDGGEESTGTPSDSGATGPTVGSGGTMSGSGGASTVASTASGMGGAGGGCAELTVKNYLSWCSVQVNDGAASTSPEQTFCVAPNTTVKLIALPAPGFVLGPWHDTDGDMGSGDHGSPPGQVWEMIGETADCVWVCCPFPDGTGCPTTDQCP